MNEEVFTGSIEELLEHVTDNQDKLIKESEQSTEDEFKMFEKLLDSMVDDGLLKKETINGETFYSNKQED